MSEFWRVRSKTSVFAVRRDVERIQEAATEVRELSGCVRGEIEQPWFSMLGR